MTAKEHTHWGHSREGPLWPLQKYDTKLTPLPYNSLGQYLLVGTRDLSKAESRYEPTGKIR